MSIFRSVFPFFAHIFVIDKSLPALFRIVWRIGATPYLTTNFLFIPHHKSS